MQLSLFNATDGARVDRRKQALGLHFAKIQCVRLTRVLQLKVVK
jgi:hypothetical protein